LIAKVEILQTQIHAGHAAVFIGGITARSVPHPEVPSSPRSKTWRKQKKKEKKLKKNIRSKLLESKSRQHPRQGCSFTY
jgi:hypothetical protein